MRTLAYPMRNTTWNRILLRPQGRLAVVLLTTWLAGCGARPGMDADPDGGGPNTDPPDAALPLPDADVLPPGCTWVAGERYQITEPPSDKGLHDLEVSDDAVLVAWMTTNPDPPHDNTRYVQRVSWEGAPIGERTALFPPPSGWTSYSNVNLATGPAQGGAILWEENTGCRFTRTDADGVTVGSLQYVDAALCSSLRSTPSGFSLFTRTGVEFERRLLRLDATGAVTHRGDPIAAISTTSYWWASAALPGEDLLVAGIHDDAEPMAIMTQRIDAWGTPLTEPAVIATAHTDARRIRLVHTGNGVLAGWLAAESPDSPEQERFVTLQRLDEQGLPLGMPFRGADVTAFRDSSWSITRKGDRLLAAIVHPLESDNYGDDTVLVLLVLDLAGNLVEPPLELTRIRFARHPRLRATPTGVLLGFQGMPDETPHQLFTISARCAVDVLPE